MRSQSWVWVVVALAVVGGGVALKNRSAPTAAPVQVQPAAQVLELLPSDVSQVSSGPLQQVLTVSGSVRALEQASVKAKVAGEVRQVLVREGEAVKAGQVLAQIEQSDYLARLEQGRGALRAAQGQLDMALNTRNNNRQLKKQNFISQNALDNAESQYAIAVANLDSAKAALDVTQKSVQDTVVRAPIDGIVSARNVQPGEKVSPDARLLDVVDLRQMEMEISVPSSDIASLAVGQKVKVNIEGGATEMAGSISRISPATQTGSRSILAYVKIANEGQKLRAGMFGQARVVLSQQADVLKVPASALYYEEGEGGSRSASSAGLYLIADNRLQRVNVQIGAAGEDDLGPMVEIKSGVTAGASIIKTNLGNLKPGIAVKVAAAKPLALPATPVTSAPSAVSAVSAAPVTPVPAAAMADGAGK